MHSSPLGSRLPAGLTSASLDEQQAWLATDGRRNRVSRRSVLKGGAGAVGILTLGQLGLLGLGMGEAWAGTAPGASGLVVLGRHLSVASDPTNGIDATNAMDVGALLTSATLPDTATAVPTGVKLFVDVEEGGPATPYSGSYSEAFQVVDIRSLTSTGQGGTTNLTQTELWVHHELTGLSPNTRYHYRLRVQEADGSTGYTTPDAWFSTAPVPGTLTPFTFTAFADQGNTPLTGVTTGNYTTLPSGNGNATPTGSTSNQFDDYFYDTDNTTSDAVEIQTDLTPALTMTRSVAAADPCFHLLGGDICYADNTGEGLIVDNYDPTAWEYYVTQIESTAAFTPWMFAVGNHDMEAVVTPPLTSGQTAATSHGYYGHEQRLDFPADRPANCPAVYAFRYQNVGIVSLDANDFSVEIPSNLDYSGWVASEPGNQLTWLTGKLAAFRADPTVDFIVCFFHECAYTSNANHGSDSGVRAELAPIFDDYQVDLVIQGHCHQYERTDPVRGGVTTRDAPYIAPAGGGGTVVHPATDGTSYVTIGSGGRPRYHWTGGSANGADSPIEGDRWGLIDPATNNPQHGSVDLGTLPATYGAPDQPGSNVLTKSELNGGTSSETPTWTSQSRYLNYAYLVVDVTPAPVGQPTTMTVSTHRSDDPSPAGIVDQVTFSRTAGEASGPAPGLAESPSALLLPAAGAAVIGAAYLTTRRHHREDRTSC